MSLEGKVCSREQRYRRSEGIFCLSLQGSTIQAAVSYKILYVSTRQCDVEEQKIIFFVACHLIQWHLPLGVPQILPISRFIIILFRYLVRFFLRWPSLFVCLSLDLSFSIHIYKGKGHPITGQQGPRGGVEV
jgi:hypothetical protein